MTSSFEGYDRLLERGAAEYRSIIRAGDSIIPRMNAISLSTAQFRWLHESDWEDPQRLAYLRLSQAPAMGVFSPIPFQKTKRRVPPSKLGRWVLTDAKEGPCAAVEVIAYQHSFTILHVQVSAWQSEAESRSWVAQSEALSLLVSALILAYKADVVRLVPLNQQIEKDMQQLGWGVEKPFWSPFKLDALLLFTDLPPGRSGVAREIDSHSWWESPQGERGRQTLSYLEKRTSFAEQADSRPKRRFKGGLLGRLLTWK